MMLDPLGISIAIANGNLGLDVACIWFKTFWHLDIVPLVFKVDGELADFVTEVVAILGELFNGETMEDFMVMDGGDEAEGDGADSIIEASCVANTVKPVCGEIGGNLGLTWTVFWGMWKGMGSVGEHGGVDIGDLLDALME